MEQLSALDFQICFVSNSEISAPSERRLRELCHRVILRENSGLDFSMWQCAIAQYDLGSYDELLLTNSSIIGPLRPLAPLWQDPAIADCDFWGLADSDEIKLHLPSYFLVFRRAVLHSSAFRDFWRGVLPYRSKDQIILSYELGLTCWLEENGFTRKSIFHYRDIIYSPEHKQRGLPRKVADYCRYLAGHGRARNLFIDFADIVWRRGAPFVKASLLRQSPPPLRPATVFGWIEQSGLSAEILEELRQEFPAVQRAT
ncbi:MAG TPA: rhamnan synthesis F family protein [Verrucomicrobiae bacterium]